MKYYVNLIKSYFKFLSLILFTIIAIGVQTINAQSSLDSLKSRLSNNAVLKSSIVHVFGDSFTGDSVITVGNLWIYRSGYRMEAEGRIILIADSISKVYHQEKNQLIISPYSAEDDDFAPSRFIEASEEDLWAIQEQEKNGFFQINLTSEDEFAPFTMIIILLNDQYCPIQVETIDSNGNTNKTIFQNPKWIPFSDDILKIDYPKSTEIIDLH